MPLPSSTLSTNSDALFAYEPTHPFQGWMRVLFVGAAFGIIAFVIDAMWAVIMLTARVRSFPPMSLLNPYAAFFTLGVASFQWTSIWLLTTEDPSPQSTPRLRANLLRLLVSASFLLLSFGVLRLIGWEGRGPALWFTSVVRLLNLAIVLLLWPHLYGLASRLAFRGIRWRIVVAMIGLLAASFVMVVPAISLWMFGQRIALDRFQESARSGMQILAATVAALVLLRFSFHFFREWRSSNARG